MKLFARIFALSLVATGAFASARMAVAPQSAAGARMSALPIPTCDPNDPGGCGIGGPSSLTFNQK